MTKKELLEMLESVPDDAVIVIPGHSDCGSSYNDCDSVTPIKIKEYKEWSWRGRYGEILPTIDDSSFMHPEIITAFLIS